MTFLQACILGLVQGLTEFLPVSSSGHLVLFPWFLGWQDPGLAFNVFLHLGTVLALLVYFWRDWVQLLHAGWRSVCERRIGFERDRLLFWMLMLANIPAGLAGLIFHEQAETVFRSPLLISMTLALVGFLLYWVDGQAPTLKGMGDITFKDALWIGLAQAAAIVPGVSRSGATMTMGRLLGLRRRDAARFSFLLAFPIIFAASAYECRSFGTDLLAQVSVVNLLAGFFCALLSGIFAIHFLLQILQTADFKYFAWYRIGLAVFILLWSVSTGR